MRVLIAASALSLAACGTTAAPEPGSEPTQTADGNDCAVIAAVAREHYQFGSNNIPPPLWLDGEGSGWKPDCDWGRYGLNFPSTYDPDAAHQPGTRIQWVSFKRPRYDGNGATIEAGILHGPLAGMGVECRVVSGIEGWTLAGPCQSNWIS